MGTRPTEDQGQYAALGVSSGKEGVHKAIAGLHPGLYPGAFCTILPDPRDPDMCFVPHADGVGTKIGLAYLIKKLRLRKKLLLNGSALRGLPHDGLVMNTDDLMCVGAVTGENPLMIASHISRNSFRVSDADLAELSLGATDFARLLTENGIPTTIYRAGETADTPDLTRTLDIGYTVTVHMRRDQVIDASGIRHGSFIVGFSSTGQAAWETEPNSGGGSNGYTLGRHGLLETSYRKHEETYAPELDLEKVYRGKYRLEDPLPGDPRFTIGSALLCRTRTYVPLVKKLIGRLGVANIQALIQCTGGAQSKIGKFGPLGTLYRKDKLFEMPALCTAIQESSGASWWEMHKTFSVGHRLELVVATRELAHEAIRISQDECGIPAKIVGSVEKGTPGKREVLLETPYGELRYE